jgi:hypothetical protein
MTETKQLPEAGTVEYVAMHLYACVENMRQMPPSREVALAITKAEEAVHWLGAEEARREEKEAKANGPDAAK